MKEERWLLVESIRARIMKEAYDLADRNDLEGYESVKLMCSDVIELIDGIIDKYEEKNT